MSTARNRLGVWAGVLALIITAGTVLAVENTPTKKFPPYPDVWGRELPETDFTTNVGTNFYDNPDGDFLILYGWRPKSADSEDNFNWRNLNFFSGDHQSVPLSEIDGYREKYKRSASVSHYSAGRLVLGGGRSIKPVDREFGGTRCSKNYASAMDVQDSRGTVTKSVMIFILYDSSVRMNYWQYCQPGGNPDHFFTKVEALGLKFFGLKDGTFLVRTIDTPYVIRFRADLTSPFLICHPKLLLVETSKIDLVVEAAYKTANARDDGFLVQEANDAIHNYLSNLKRNRKNCK